jgi:hypothetical protein
MSDLQAAVVRIFVERNKLPYSAAVWFAEHMTVDELFNHFRYHVEHLGNVDEVKGGAV